MASDSEQTPHPQTETPKTAGGEAQSDSSRHHRWCDCPPWHHCGHCGPPPHCDPYCGPYPYRWRHHRHHEGHWPPLPGSEFFEAMAGFAASTAGFRERWWRQMADAARYARRDSDYCDPCYDPCAPRWSHCDPCAPPWDRCEPCPPYEACDPCGDPQQINMKELRQLLCKMEEAYLKDQPDESGERKKKIDAWIDEMIHDVKLARVAEAMRRKQWSRGGERRW
jgi:Fe-S-cluster formation regulator IscX/YfhJ